MKTKLLIQMIEHAYNNQRSKKLLDLALQIAVDPELDDDITIESFNNPQYSVFDQRIIKQVINYHVI